MSWTSHCQVSALPDLALESVQPNHGHPSQVKQLQSGPAFLSQASRVRGPGHRASAPDAILVERVE